MTTFTSHTAQPAVRMPLLQTGVSGFDQILGGGFPAHSLYLIQGLAGSGKTTLACQIGFQHAHQGKKVLILTLIAALFAIKLFIGFVALLGKLLVFAVLGAALFAGVRMLSSRRS